MTAPVVVPGTHALAARAVAAEFSLTAVEWGDFYAATPDGWVTFYSAAEAQAYADEMTATTLSYGETAVQWAGWLEPVLSFAGISGVEDWVSDQYGLFAEILSPGWHPLSWFEGWTSSVMENPEEFFRPIADFDLGWLYGLLGIAAEDGTQLDGLMELASGYVGGMLIWQLMGIYAVVPGALNAVVDGVISLDDLFPGGDSYLDILAYLAGESMMDWMISTEETLLNSIDGAVDILENSPGVQWILDIVSQFTDGLGVELPF